MFPQEKRVSSCLLIVSLPGLYFLSISSLSGKIIPLDILWKLLISLSNSSSLSLSLYWPPRVWETIYFIWPNCNKFHHDRCPNQQRQRRLSPPSSQKQKHARPHIRERQRGYISRFWEEWVQVGCLSHSCSLCSIMPSHLYHNPAT